MTCRLLFVSLLVLAPATTHAAPPPPPAAQARTADEAEIIAIVQRMEDAWNAHDAKAYADLFHEDGAFITFRGDYLKGRQAIETDLARVHATTYRNSVTERRIEDISFVGPDAAVVHVYRINSGVAAKPIPSRNTLVITRRNGAWAIHAFQNTRLAEREAK